MEHHRKEGILNPNEEDNDEPLEENLYDNHSWVLLEADYNIQTKGLETSIKARQKNLSSKKERRKK